MSWQCADSGDDQPSWFPNAAARKPGSLLTLCQFVPDIDWLNRFAILGHFVKAVKFIGIQQAGRQSGDRAYFVVLIESRSPSLQARSQQEWGFEGIDNNYLPSSHFVPQHLSKLNRTPWIIHNIKCSIYTGHWLTALSTVWSMESWKNNRYFELNGFALEPFLRGFSVS